MSRNWGNSGLVSPDDLKELWKKHSIKPYKHQWSIN